jgi:mannosyltransferase OCH1-like enzyme
MPRIPQIIHQIWIGPDGQPMPELLSELANTWIQHHPDCQYILWGEDSLHELLQAKFPDLVQLMTSYAYEIQRIDVYKWLLLHEFGGLYVDLDCKCLRPIFPLFEDNSCVLSQNSEEGQSIIGTFFIASTPQNVFVKEMIKNLSGHIENKLKNPAKADIVMSSTGTLYVTDQYNRYKEKDEILVLNYKHIAPLTPTESKAMMRSGVVEEKTNDKLEKASAVHYFFGMWWT